MVERVERGRKVEVERDSLKRLLCQHDRGTTLGRKGSKGVERDRQNRRTRKSGRKGRKGSKGSKGSKVVERVERDSQNRRIGKSVQACNQLRPFYGFSPLPPLFRNSSVANCAENDFPVPRETSR